MYGFASIKDPFWTQRLLSGTLYLRYETWYSLTVVPGQGSLAQQLTILHYYKNSRVNILCILHIKNLSVNTINAFYKVTI